MNGRKRLSISLILTFVLCSGTPPARAQTMEELHQRALKEGGVVNFYGTLAQITAAQILAVFEKRFPGVKVNHIDATPDKLAARAITEARGGKVLGDVFQTQLENIVQLYEQGLLLEKLPPEAAAYPNNYKGSYWMATEFDYIIGSWNTNLVKKQEEPKEFDDFADPRWKGRLVAEPRDSELLVGLAKYKFKSDEKAIALLKRMAANNIEFHRGHSSLAELLVAGQASACVTCFSHHYPPRIKKGAPVNYMLSEGVAAISGQAVFKDAPHPNAAWLFARWVASEEGQTAYAQGSRNPAHPKVEPAEKTRPNKIYALVVEDYKEFPKYEKIWREIFRLR
ncbi:MAG: ABC transporter substrate-binding protein [Candidatus Binatia bacterium]